MKKYLFICCIIISSCTPPVKIPDNELQPSIKKTTNLNIQECIPKDTIIKKGNLFVRYLNHDNFFDISVGGRNWQKSLGYHLDCNMPQSIIPHYDWSNNSVIALINGCGGNYCSINTFFNIKTGTLVRRDNVIIKDEKKSLIAYFDSDSVLVIENILSSYKIRYPIGCEPPCANLTQCIKQLKFSQSYLSIKWMVLTPGGKEKIIEKRYNYSAKENP